MTVEVVFECDGCRTKTKGTSFLLRRFMSLTGKSHGFGSYTYDTPQDVAPEGWIAFDPYTGACYCPNCWAEALNQKKDWKIENGYVENI